MSGASDDFRLSGIEGAWCELAAWVLANVLVASGGMACLSCLVLVGVLAGLFALSMVTPRILRRSPSWLRAGVIKRYNDFRRKGAGRQWSATALLTHVGRRSGQTYQTPRDMSSPLRGSPRGWLHGVPSLPDRLPACIRAVRLRLGAAAAAGLDTVVTAIHDNAETLNGISQTEGAGDLNIT
jgi:hypothetical protein